jgi:hypothetical protein
MYDLDVAYDYVLPLASYDVHAKTRIIKPPVGDWCKENGIGTPTLSHIKANVKPNMEGSFYTFTFQSEDDAALFKLKWLAKNLKIDFGR